MPLKSIFLFLFSCIGFVVVGSAQDNRVWATYYGGEGDDGGNSLAIDAFGNVYLTGSTNSMLGIASGGYQNTFGGGNNDAFLVKFDSDGNRLWATYYGGNGDDVSINITTDAIGNVYLTGCTSSPFGIASDGFQNTYGGGAFDAFIVKFDPNGIRLWATYYGGIGYDVGACITTDVVGNLYISGQTSGTSGIASVGFQNIYGGGIYDAFLVKFDTNGNRLWASYYGGTGDDRGYSITTDDMENVYLTGYASSASGIASGGFQNTYSGGMYDVFLVKFDANGNRLWATYYGGVDDDRSYSVTTDATGNLYIAGNTTTAAGIASGGFQNIYAGWVDAFLVKFNAAGNRLWATYFGGTNGEEGYKVTTDAASNVYFAGDSYSDNGIASGGFQGTLEGEENMFVAKFDSAGTRLCSTYYGQVHDEGGYVGVDRLGNVYLSGSTPSDSEIASEGFQNTFGGGYHDACLIKFSSCGPLTAGSILTNFTCFGLCTGKAMAVPSGGITPYNYSWNTTPEQTTQQASSLCPGTYSVTVTDAADSSVTVYITINDGLNIPLSITQNGDTLYASGGQNYQWYLNDTLISGATSSNYVITNGGYYYVTNTDSCTFTSNSIETGCLCVGISENPLFQSISLFPNPANEQLNIIVQLSNAEAATIKLTDAFGRKVYQKEETQKATSFNWQIPLSGFAAGIYFAEITVLGQKQYRKIAVQR